MGSVGVEADDDGSIVKEFLQRCEPSGDAAYGELRALLARLHDPATRRDARLFLAALHRHQQRSSSAAGGLTHEQFFRRFGFRMQELLLQDTATDITASSFIATKPAAAAEFECVSPLGTSHSHSLSSFDCMRGRCFAFAVVVV
ncbi:Methionine S-methyltransferase [Zea mays]|uniref:Methionine S-methyltransferase n=1 Tax=Zea mays TaxID=4577 RepID=A0A1D6FWI1_MAIZE|nr:Methionine S-methyltransferase [Zea mays]